MKKCTGLLLGLLLASALPAQTWEEWFEQKETQLRYLRESIAALRSYGEVVEKGYRIARQGLTVLGQIKEGDLLQHRERITSLSRVNPALQELDWVVVAEDGLAALEQVSARQLRLLSESGQFTPSEIRYHQQVFERLGQQGHTLVQQIRTLTEEGRAELTDGERLHLLRAGAAALQECYAVARRFASGSMRLALQRYREHRDIQSMKRLYAQD